MLILARESRGLTQSGLAKLLSIPQGKLSKIESSVINNMPEDFLSKLSNILDYPEPFFLQDEQI